MRVRGGRRTSLLPYRYSPSAPSRLTASNGRLAPPSPLPADSKFRNLIRGLQHHVPRQRLLSARARESLVPSFRRNRRIHLHLHPKSAKRLRAQRTTDHPPNCENNATLNNRR